MIHLICKNYPDWFRVLEQGSSNVVAATLEDVVRYVTTVDKVCIDVETTPKEEFKNYYLAGLDPHTSNIVMLQIGDYDHQYVIDVRDYTYDDLELLFQGLTRPDILLIGHNIVFDLKMLRSNFGLYIKNANCTYVQEKIITNGNQMSGYSLEVLTSKYIRKMYRSKQMNLYKSPIETDDDTIFLTKDIRSNFKFIGNREFTYDEVVYGAYDVKNTFDIWRLQLRKLVQLNLIRTYLLESAFIAVTVEMSYNGIRLDQEAWLANADESAKLSEELKEEFISLLKADRSEAMMEFKKSIQSPSLFEEDHLEINLNSPIQMIPLFKALGINLENQKASKKKSKSSNVSADTLEESVLKKYKSIPLVDTYIKYRHTLKQASTYGSMFLKKFLNPATGRLHSSFNSVNTGRLSSSNPNLQNIPRSKRFRNCFIPEKDKTLIVADYSAQEVRSLAAVTNEEKLIAFLSEKGADIHKFTASNIFSKPLESITDDERYLGKVVNFLIPYGGGASNLQQLTGRDLDYCKKVIESYYDNYPKIKSYFKQKFNKTLIDGYITINDFTFRKYFDDKSFKFVRRVQEVINNYGYNSVDEQELQDFKIAKSRIERKVKNYSIQGLSADMTKMAMVILLNRILSDGLFDKIKIVLSVHDEIVLESDLDTSEVACKMLEDAMNEAGNMLTSMEFFAEANVGSTWAEAK